ncbi:hypothetical protein [Limnohabitans sp.]|uniref:hypothetical protein n=1 Tax=Limnohabitans sp. TaxID=1907725 RepID=UPI0038B89C23
MKKQHIAHALTLLSAALLAACGGGGGGGSGAITLNGVALKGPLNGAIACADVNGNGLCDDGAANQVRTNADGTFTLSLTSPMPILVVTDATTKDDRGNSLAAGTVLKAPAGSTVVSVATTILSSMLAAGYSTDQVATALGYTSADAPPDFKTYNPFKGTTDADKEKQWRFETGSMQVYTAISAIAAGASSTGADSGSAFNAAFKALAEKVKDSSGNIDFSSASVVDDIAGKTKVNMAGISGFDAGKFEAARSDLKAAVANVNTKIKAIDKETFITSSADTNSLYAVATKSVSDQVASRVKDDVPVALADTANIDAVLTEQKKAASTTLAKISDMVGFWEGTFGDLTAGAVVLGDGTAWVVVNGTVPRVVKATLAVNGGMLSGTGLGYTVGSATTAPVAMTASLDSAKLKGSLTGAKREAYEFSAANANVYATAATYGSFAKTWSGVNSGRTMAWTFSSTGALTGSSVTTGCSYTGQLTLRSEAKALVNAQVVETCPGVSAAVTYNGIAYINKDSQAVFTLLSSQGPVLLRF